MTPNTPNVGLFVTCLVNLFRPSVGFASIKLLEEAGCKVTIPEAQTCCGQPGYNPGDFDSTRKIAKQVISTFEKFDYIVIPSGSCSGMLSHHYPALFKSSSSKETTTDDKEWFDRATTMAAKTFELTSFLHDVLKIKPEKPIVNFSEETFTYHDSCAGLREMGIKDQPRDLLKSYANATITELKNTEECCGFGGTFCAKMPDISSAMVTDKLTAAMDTNAGTLLGGDLGCLLNIAGRATRTNKKINVRHVAEVLANDLSSPAIGEGSDEASYQSTAGLK